MIKIPKKEIENMMDRALENNRKNQKSTNEKGLPIIHVQSERLKVKLQKTFPDFTILLSKTFGNDE